MMPLNVYVNKTYNTINSNISINTNKPNKMQKKIIYKNQINHVDKNIFFKNISLKKYLL